VSRLLNTAISISVILSSLCAGATTSTVAVQPTSFNFGKQYLNRQYEATTITIINTGTTAFSLSSYTVNGPFRWAAGLVPQRIPPNYHLPISIGFWPTAAGLVEGSLVLNFNNGVPSVTVPLSGTGGVTNAAISYSTTELVFPSQTVGTSATQSLVLTNTGKSLLKVTNGLVTPNTFSVSGVTFPFTLAPGNSMPLTVTYAPVLPVTQRGTISFTFDSLNFSGVGVLGTATAATALTVATTSPIPGPATRNAAYSYQLDAAGGTPPYAWALTSGNLPPGLTLNSQGVISGTVSSTSGSDTFFTVQVSDATSATASGALSIEVVMPSTAHCSNLNWEITGTGSPEVPMDVLGTGTYMGYEGGLYPGGSNTIPAGHQQDGINIAAAIQPLDANGNPSPTGKYGLLALGTSDAAYEFNRFIEYATGEQSINPNLGVAEGAMGAEALDTMLGVEGSAFWNNIDNWFLPDAGLTPQQVVAIWLEPEDAHPPGPFPEDMQNIYNELRTFIPSLQTRFPNLKLLYLSSRTYAGYANPLKEVTEPYSYDQGYALQAIIADQLNGDPALNYNPNLGPVVAPWLGWESYKWGNGMTEHNGLVWACPDFRTDGYHVSAAGEDKVSGLLMNFLKSDPTAAPWFYVPSTTKH
jgi:hypothetical protein